MQTADVLIDAFERIKGVTHRTVEGLTPDVLVFRPDDDANSIAWLVWHLARVQDDHVANAAGTEQIWTSQGWYERFGLPFAPSSIGYGQTSDDVAAVQVGSADLLLGYYDPVHEQTLAYVRTLEADDLDRIVDESWDPPVSLGVRLVSVISDSLQHAGQVAYVRGIAERQGNA